MLKDEFLEQNIVFQDVFQFCPILSYVRTNTERSKTRNTPKNTQKEK